MILHIRAVIGGAMNDKIAIAPSSPIMLRQLQFQIVDSAKKSSRSRRVRGAVVNDLVLSGQSPKVRRIFKDEAIESACCHDSRTSWRGRSEFVVQSGVSWRIRGSVGCVVVHSCT